MNTGRDFVKMIGPFGSALFLLLFVLFMVFAFTSGLRTPLAGYEPPHGSSYYSESGQTLAELKTELEENVFPKLEGVLRCEQNGETLTVIIRQEKFEAVRKQLLKFYDESLFQFVGEETSA